MTALEKAYEKMQKLPEWKIEAVLAYIQVLDTDDYLESSDENKKDFEELQALRKTVGNRVPKDFDPRTEYQEALDDKYGSLV